MSNRLVRTRPVCRRRFLIGAGGVTLGLPFLPSLATRQAYAADPVIPRERCFFAMVTFHGGAWDSNMFPAVNTLTEQVPYAAAGHAVRWGRLAAAPSDGGNVALSPILKAPATRLTPKLAAKLNVLRGLDTAMHIGHNRGGVLGNFADTNAKDQLGLKPRPTLDQIMAWSPSFYPTLTGVKERSLGYGPSWGYSNPQTFSGVVQPVRMGYGSRDLFDRLFGGMPNANAPAPRKPIVDRVLANYKRLREGDRRLSLDDRRRLDDHISRLDELQRRLSDVPARNCQTKARPTEDARMYGDGYSYSDPRKFAQLYFDVFAMAFACGASRIATIAGGGWEKAISFSGNWHQDVAHQWNGSGQSALVRYYNEIFANFFLDMAGKLDAIEVAPGRTLLDDSLVMWTQECGMETHMQNSIPVITAGGAGGSLETGLYVDYRNMDSKDVILSDGLPAADRVIRHGLLYNQWLATALQAVGVPRAEFERWGHRGFGDVGFGTVPGEYAPAPTRAYYQGADSKYFQIASDPLPVIMG